MTIQHIYNTYSIPPHLQLHMLRVAAICKVICEAKNVDVNATHTIMCVALLHDMGNILKFDMNLYPEVREPKGVEYRKKIKKEFKKYGKNEHEATINIAKKIGIERDIKKTLIMFEESYCDEILASKDIILMIVEYADGRVTPHGVASLTERISGFEKRNIHNKGITIDESQARTKRRSQAANQLEAEIFNGISLIPTDIHDDSISPLIDGIRTYEIIREN